MPNIPTAQIIDGKAVTGTTSTYQTTDNRGTTSLGKDAFLQLLVTQMQYQDPLEPTDNTQMVSELAQFSALEEMQNLSSTVGNTQALSLVGRNVVLEVGKSTDSSTTTTVAGYVEYAKLENGKVKLSIKGKLYDYADLEYLIDDYYLADQMSTDSGEKTSNDEPSGDEPSGDSGDGE